MPANDGTGPEGLGAMTGRGLGTCVGTTKLGRPGNPGIAGFGCGRGRGRMFNRGGYGRRARGEGPLRAGRMRRFEDFAQPMASTDELEQRLDVLQASLDEMAATLSRVKNVPQATENDSES